MLAVILRYPPAAKDAVPVLGYPGGRIVADTCKHDWAKASSTITAKIITTYYRCSKCGATTVTTTMVDFT